MKILYGVVGEGMGHAIRSAVTIEHLVCKGHEVEIVVSGRAADYLRSRFEGVQQIWGLTMVMSDNELSKRGTAKEILGGALGGIPDNIRRYLEMTDRFAPDVVISDFESFTGLYAKAQNLPLICIDNIQMIRRCKHPKRIIEGKRRAFELANQVVKGKVPRADHYIITTFFDADLRKKRTTLVPPILRQMILDATPTEAEHVLVYQTSESFVSLPEVLKSIDMPFKIYGLRRGLDKEVKEGNLTFCPFSEDGFVSDLASSRAVIGSAGFTLVGEALHLGKPYLATPVRGQFEQIMNGRYLEDLGYGTYAETLERDTILDFLESTPTYAKRIAAEYEPQDNSALFDAVDTLLDKAAAGLSLDLSF